jgi:hypothetical protein
MSIANYANAIGSFQQAGELKSQSILDRYNAKLTQQQAGKQAAMIKRAGAAQESQISTQLAAAGVAGTSPTAQMLNDTLNKNVQSDIMQTLLEGKINALNLNYRSKQEKSAATASLISGALSAIAGGMS